LKTAATGYSDGGQDNVPDGLLPLLLAVSATAIMQPLDALKIRRWWDLFMGKEIAGAVVGGKRY
jgi:hypothetical protein